MAKRGPKFGHVSCLRKFGVRTKVKRVPEHWDVESIYAALEAAKSLVTDYESEIETSRQASAGMGKPLNSRLQKVAELCEQLRQTAPEIFQATQ